MIYPWQTRLWEEREEWTIPRNALFTLLFIILADSLKGKSIYRCNTRGRILVPRSTVRWIAGSNNNADTASVPVSLPVSILFFAASNKGAKVILYIGLSAVSGPENRSRKWACNRWCFLCINRLFWSKEHSMLQDKNRTSKCTEYDSFPLAVADLLVLKYDVVWSPICD